MLLAPDNLQNECTFSPCRKYRYTWSRDLGQDGPPCLFVMLNPSTADETATDPTVRRCIGYATRWGCGRLTVVNLFAIRATDPKAMLAADDPIGPVNDAMILSEAFATAAGKGRIVCGWGSHGRHMGRSTAVRDMLANYKLRALKINAATGEPAHPLYLRGDLAPITL